MSHPPFLHISVSEESWIVQFVHISTYNLYRPILFLILIYLFYKISSIYSYIHQPTIYNINIYLLNYFDCYNLKTISLLEQIFPVGPSNLSALASLVQAWLNSRKKRLLSSANCWEMASSSGSYLAQRVTVIGASLHYSTALT